MTNTHGWLHDLPDGQAYSRHGKWTMAWVRCLDWQAPVSVWTRRTLMPCTHCQARPSVRRTHCESPPPVCHTVSILASSKSSTLLGCIAMHSIRRSLLLHMHSSPSECVSDGHKCEPCKNGWTDQDAIWGVDSCGPKGQIPHVKMYFWGTSANSLTIEKYSISCICMRMKVCPNTKRSAVAVMRAVTTITVATCNNSVIHVLSHTRSLFWLL